jgi:small-conductance mechanosensitive channel
MEILNQLLVLGQTWTGSVLTLLGAALLLFLRRFLPKEQQRHINTPLFFLLLAFVLGLGATVMLKSGAYTVWGILSFLNLLCLIVGVTSLVGLLVFDLALNRTRVRVPALVRNLIQLSIIFLIVVTILYQRGLDPLSLLTTSAVLTAVVGLALQNTIANLFAGLALHLDRTLGLGDWIQVGESVGRIAEIKWRSTSLWTEDGDLLIVPNSQLLDAEVRNLSRPDNVQRQEVTVGFHYRHPPNEVKQVLIDTARTSPGVLTVPAPDCILAEFADSAIGYTLRFWINDYTHHAIIESEVRTRIWYAAQRAGLEIPFPLRTLILPSRKSEVAERRDESLADHRTALKQINLFTMLDDEAQMLLAAKMQTVRFGAGEDILREGECGALHLVRSGEVTIYLTVDGIRKEVATLTPGNFFGEKGLIAGEAQPAGYAAKSDTLCAVIDHAALAQLLAARPQLAEDLSAELARCEMTLKGEREQLSALARARHAAETKSRFLAGIRRVFQVS